MSKEYLLLKWGTVKGWNIKDGPCFDILKKFLEGSSMSCAMDFLSSERKEMLVELINNFDGEITNDWTGGPMTKNEAIEYVKEYRNE